MSNVGVFVHCREYHQNYGGITSTLWRDNISTVEIIRKLLVVSLRCPDGIPHSTYELWYPSTLLDILQCTYGITPEH